MPRRPLASSPSTCSTRTDSGAFHVGLMVVGIGFIGVFTATLTTFLLEPVRNEQTSLEDRLTSIDEKLDRLLRERT